MAHVGQKLLGAGGVGRFEATGLDLGGVVAWCSDLPEHETSRLFAEKVLPELR